MGHLASGSARKRSPRTGVAVIVAAVALAAPLLFVAPASAGSVPKSVRAQLRGVTLNEARALGIKHPSLSAVLTTYAAYSKAFPGSPKLKAGKVYVVQVVGKYTVLGKAFKAFELIFDAKSLKALIGINSTTVKGLGKLGSVARL
jgi:hypothetical protein